MVVLPPLQYSIIKALAEVNEPIDADSLASKVGKRAEDIMRDLEELRVRGLISIEYRLVTRVTLTDLGGEYLRLGLPEERLVAKLRELGGKASLSELNKLVGLSREEFAAALGRLRRLRVVNLSGNVINLTDNEGELMNYINELKSFLSSIKGTMEYAGKLPEPVEEARRRGLVKVHQVKKLMVTITQEALNLYRIGELTSARVITSLTSADLTSGSWRSGVFKEFDLAVEVPLRPIRRKHPFIQFLNQIRDELVAMGFEEVKDEHVDAALWNFDTLLVPQYHPARRETDVFYVENRLKPRETPVEVMERASEQHELVWSYKWSRDEALRVLLRTHTTLVTIRQIYHRGPGEYRLFSLDRVYRPDTPDPTHFMEFHQLEGIIVGKEVTFRNLLGFFTELANRLRLGKVYFKPAYFPFTEPSVEGYVKHPRLGQLEVFPGGMFRPEVLKIVGLSSEYKVAAWGVGIDRLAMVVLGVDDIRTLYTNNIKEIDSMKTPIGVV
ncbi:phenylalanine--tRNA ligase subunit alpha [Caldivirga sp. UBA161]|uniref:phenylalanine--tRNA ligase subunit alpha n=1 Tax=Caldivirga sp. UBA161 TaxID=1915569 RepID=UPI0025BEDA3C|nr:phenylalanine--tRNA ligase subunit alpha [Caldivirga sp. UBA161]